MEIIYPSSNKKSIHPIGIFKEGLGIWQSNFLCLSGIYLIFYSPSIILQMLQLFLLNANPLTQQGVSSIIALLNFLIGSAVFVALSIAVNKATSGVNCKIIKIITQLKK